MFPLEGNFDIGTGDGGNKSPKSETSPKTKQKQRYVSKHIFQNIDVLLYYLFCIFCVRVTAARLATRSIGASFLYINIYIYIHGYINSVRLNQSNRYDSNQLAQFEAICDVWHITGAKSGAERQASVMPLAHHWRSAKATRK